MLHPIQHEACVNQRFQIEICRGFVRENGDWLHAGNVYTSDGAESFIRECCHKVKDLAGTDNVSMDSGFYDKEIVAECERLGVGFTITADQTAPVLCRYTE